MKKIARLLLTAVMLAAMLSVFAAPAFAMDIGKVPPIAPLESLSLPDLIAELEKKDKDKIGGKIGGNASSDTGVVPPSPDTGREPPFGRLDLADTMDNVGNKVRLKVRPAEEARAYLFSSAFSTGSLAVVTGVAGLAVGIFVAMLIFKKKKPTLSHGKETEETGSESEE